MAGGPDPLGKRALFWMPVAPTVPVDADDPTPSRGRNVARPTGKHALYSTGGTAPLSSETGGPVPSTVASDDPLPDRGRFTMVCSSCEAVTRVGLLDLVVLGFPVAVWLPRGTFDRRMTCPACRRRTWVSLSLTR
jgi:hypothetical protein